MRNLIAIAFSFFVAASAFATQREAPFRIESARVEKFGRTIEARGVKYDTALVLRIAVDLRDYERLPMANVPVLYIGSHELRIFTEEFRGDVVILGFHDPNWTELKGGEPMVLTTEHGAPLREPERYADRPRFDPKIIQ